MTPAEWIAVLEAGGEVTESGRESPRLRSRDEALTCELTNICSSEYAVFSCAGGKGGGRCPTNRQPPSALCASSPCRVSPPPSWRSAKRCAPRQDACGPTCSPSLPRRVHRDGGAAQGSSSRRLRAGSMPCTA